MISSGTDVVAFLEEQHDQIEVAFDTVLSARGEQRETAFHALRRLLAVHETAEEEIVHPAARKALPDGDVIADARLAEENAAKKQLATLERLAVESSEFVRGLEQLRTSVLEHARAEEEQEFSLLAEMLDQSRLESMRKAVSFAESVAPTRPHAGVESATANVLGGPFAAMLDRARDAISGKHYLTWAASTDPSASVGIVLAELGDIALRANDSTWGFGLIGPRPARRLLTRCPLVRRIHETQSETPR
jgi:hemerythrin superfamily protein